MVTYNFRKVLAVNTLWMIRNVKAECPGPKVIKLFSCSTQLSMKFTMLINIKMPTIVGILTFISMTNITSERLKARYFFLLIGILVFMSSLNFMLSCVEHEKSFVTSGPGS